MKRFKEYMNESQIQDLPRLKDKVRATFEGYGLEHSDEQLQKLIDLTRFQLDNRPFPTVIDVVFPAGSGKSTYLIDNVKFLATEKQSVVGGFVIKSKRSEVHEFCEKANEGWNKTVAYPYLTESDEDEWGKEEATLRDEQKNFTFVCMTWEKFKRMSSSGQLPQINRFKVANDWRTRSLVLIDEMPSLNETFPITMKDIQRIEEITFNLNVKGKISDKNADLMNVACRVLKKHLAQVPKEPEINSRLAPAFEVPLEVKNSWSKETYRLEDKEALEQFEKALTKRTKHHTSPNGSVSLSVNVPVNLPTQDYKVIVFDASSMIDPEVPLSWEVMSFNFKGNEYRNMKLVYVKGETCSRQAMERIKTFIPDVALKIKTTWLNECKSFPHKVILVATHQKHIKKLEDEVNRLFVTEIEEERVKIYFKHFDGGRGTNSYSDSTLVFHVGAFTTNDSVYSLKATENELIENVKANGADIGCKFEDERLQDFLEGSTASALYQEIQRTRAYDSETPKVAYIFMNNNNVVQKATREFVMNGATIEVVNSLEKKWFKHREKPEFTKTEMKLLDVARNMNDHSKMSKKEFVELAGCTSKTLGNALKGNESFKTELEQLGVKVEYRTIVKTEPLQGQPEEEAQEVQPEEPTIPVDPNPLTRKELEEIEFG